MQANTDVWRLIHSFRRPIPLRQPSLGVWNHVLNFAVAFGQS